MLLLQLVGIIHEEAVQPYRLLASPGVFGQVALGALVLVEGATEHHQWQLFLRSVVGSPLAVLLVQLRSLVAVRNRLLVITNPVEVRCCTRHAYSSEVLLITEHK